MSIGIAHKGVHYMLEIVDTPGQEDYAHLRPFYYAGADVILLCYSIIYPDSFTNTTECVSTCTSLYTGRWIPEGLQNVQMRSL